MFIDSNAPPREHGDGPVRLTAMEAPSPPLQRERQARVPAEPRSGGDTIPANCVLIEVHVGELKQLFNSIDPSPFRERDLDPNTEEFIVGWAREAGRDARLALL